MSVGFPINQTGTGSHLFYPRDGRDNPLPKVHIAVAILLDVAVLEASNFIFQS